VRFYTCRYPRNPYTPAVLRLAAATDPAWTACALASLDDLLVDHAHCEKKAAGTAINLLFRYPQQGFLLDPLSRLAREELVHFEQVLAVLAQRGVPFAVQKPAPYAGRLRRETRSAEPARLLDILLCGALIEARSCERFGLLAERVPDPALRGFYRGLLAAEARHHGVYLELAERLASRPEVAARLDTLAQREAEILAGGPPLPRMHG
jgi:tRNA 2-(methylsulfanyl)-N6-isopentenyladenosine37 hydroxylase